MIQAALHLTAAALICFLTGSPPPPVLLLCLTLALLPDLDTPKSIIGSFSLPVSEAIERQVGHRTATHSLLALLTVGGIVYLLLPVWWIPLTGSYASHILLALLIGKQGVLLFWPHREWQSLTSWRDDGPAPRRMLILLLPILVVVTVWPYVSTNPALAQPIASLGTAANPIATSSPPSPMRTPLPGVSVSFALPAGVGMHSLAVQVGAVVTEGQPLARWNLPTPTPWPTPTLPPAEPRPEPVAPAIIVPPPPADQSALTAAQAELGAAQAELAPQREALRLRQAQEATEVLRQRDQAALALAQLQPRHEREQTECQHAVTVAAQELAAAQAALGVPEADALPRAAGQVRAAQATLTKALDAQARMRTEQGVERERLTTTLAQAQADLAALLAHHASERTTLEGQLAATLTRAQGRVAAAHAALAAAAAHAEDSTVRLAATAQAQAQATATVATQDWQERAAARLGVHATAVAATAAALPTPGPNQIVSRVSGRVAQIKAEQHDGQLVVTVELVAD